MVYSLADSLSPIGFVAGSEAEGGNVELAAVVIFQYPDEIVGGREVPKPVGQIADFDLAGRGLLGKFEPEFLLGFGHGVDRKSTRLNSSHGYISYALFFFNDTATTEIYTLSLHALPIYR